MRETRGGNRHSVISVGNNRHNGARLFRRPSCLQTIVFVFETIVFVFEDCQFIAVFGSAGDQSPADDDATNDRMTTRI